MTIRKFSAGDRVRLLPDMRAAKLGHEGIYVVVKAMPDEGRMNQYRIKHETDPIERVVNETQIASAAEME